MGWGKQEQSKTTFSHPEKCIRILFGNTEDFLDKIRPCARTRAFGDQKIGVEFYSREPSKPLFMRENILTIHSTMFINIEF